MSAARTDFEELLERALRPVEPPAVLVQRLESTLQDLTTMAQEELDAWELGAMRDPRNWARPAAAAVVGLGAGSALVALRVRSSHRRRSAAADNPIDLATRTLRDVAREARRVF